MDVILAAILFILISASILAFGYRHYVRPSRMLDQLANSNSDMIAKRYSKEKKKALTLSSFLEPLGNLLPISAQDSSIARRELIAAGYRSNSAVAVYYGIKISLAAILLIGGLFIRNRLDNPLQRIILPVAATGIGYLGPGFVLGRLVRRRHDQIRLALPDVLDLLVICTEAGCGLDQAMVNVSNELRSVHPAVSEELSLLNMEIMAGTARADALRSFAKRTGEDEVKKLVSILIQTDRFGTSVADALRTQSDYLRIRRRQEAEERAGKVGVKLVFPIFFFCLPALLVVTAGPGMLQLFTNLLPAMNNMSR
jgi:tight adherence protein C